MLFKEQLSKNDQENNFESKEEMDNQKELVMKNLDKAQEALDSIGGEEGLKKSIEELGAEKIDSIVKGDKIKNLYQKIKEVIGYAAVAPAFASITYFLTELYNQGYHSGGDIDSALTTIVTGVGVALIEIGVIVSWAKEKKAKEEKESSIGVSS